MIKAFEFITYLKTYLNPWVKIKCRYVAMALRYFSHAVFSPLPSHCEHSLPTLSKPWCSFREEDSAKARTIRFSALKALQNLAILIGVMFFGMLETNQSLAAIGVCFSVTKG